VKASSNADAVGRCEETSRKSGDTSWPKFGGCEGSESASVAAKDRRVGKLDIEIGVE